MVLNPPIERLHLALTGLVALERRIERTIVDFQGRVSDHPAARNLQAEVEEMAVTHLDALCQRIQTMPDDSPRAHAAVNGLSTSHKRFR